MVIEDSKKKAIHVTEVQDGRSTLLQFEEFTDIRCSDTIVGIKVVGKYPNETADAELKDQWVELIHHKVRLANLVWVGKQLNLRFNSSIDLPQFCQFNIPVFEFDDGFYMLPEQSSYFIHDSVRDISQAVVKNSFSFTGLLKVNKILQYIAQVMKETQDVALSIESYSPIDNQEHKYFRDCIEKCKERIRKSKDNLKFLHSQTKDFDCGFSSSSRTSTSINEDYGSEYSAFAQDKAKYNSLQAKKLKQCIRIVRHLELSTFIELNSSEVEDNAFCIEFKYVDSDSILGATNKQLINSQLGYYLLVVKLIAQMILFVPLPHSLSFMGSNSLVDDELPFYTPEKPNQQHNIRLQMAIERFNLNVNQVKQYMEHHR